MNISIIGLGWLGTPLARHLQNEGHSIVGTTTSSEKIKTLNTLFDVYILNLNDFKNIDSAIYDKCDIAIITIPPFIKDPIDFYGITLSKLVSQFNDNTKFIFTSSTSVYPKQSGTYNESSVLNENSPISIAESKLKEKLKNRLTILRLGGLYGPKRHPIHHLQGKQNIKNPNGVINFVHLYDVIKAVDKIITTNTFGSTFNIVHPDKPTRIKYYNQLIKQLELSPIAFDQSNEEPTLRIIDSTKYLSLFDISIKQSLHPPFE